MSEPAKPIRTWREIAEEVSHEEDPARLRQLGEELERALDDLFELPHCEDR
jgi:hypothetical protein